MKRILTSNIASHSSVHSYI